MSLLELKQVSRRFGGLVALDAVDMTIREGEIVGLIGPNGAGKTTLVNVVTGAQPPSSGEVLFEGRSIGGWKPHRIGQLGIARTYQVVQPFPEMTVLENVMAPATFAARAPDIATAREKAREALAFVGLDGEAETVASQLTLAGRKRLELAKSLAMEPKVLLLDEVNAGLNPAEIDKALDLIRRIADRGVTVMIIEHLMKVVMTLCTRIVVLHHGAKIAEGTPAEIARNDEVVQAYLGTRYTQTLRKTESADG